MGGILRAIRSPNMAAPATSVWIHMAPCLPLRGRQLGDIHSHLKEVG